MLPQALGAASLWSGYGLFGLAAAFVASRLIMFAAVQLSLHRVVSRESPSPPAPASARAEAPVA